MARIGAALRHRLPFVLEQRGGGRAVRGLVLPLRFDSMQGRKDVGRGDGANLFGADIRE